ncbi:hypothetical protein DL95DRAFT_319063, partial [Leptodontidium sp. 2 PMI_412]
FLETETKQRTIKELGYVFGVPTRIHIHYQLFKALPWWVNRYVLFRRNSGPLEPLYRFEATHSQVDQLYANDKELRRTPNGQ